MENFELDWSKKHILKTNNEKAYCSDEISHEEALKKRKEVEPWLAAIFQSEHFSVLLGSGLTNAVCYMAGVTPQGMWRLELTSRHQDKIKTYADNSAAQVDRGEANIEDDIRVTNELIAGLKILGDSHADALRTELDAKLLEFITNVLNTESNYLERLRAQDNERAQRSFSIFKSFLLSFTSRSASRDRVNIFTTNYDRFIELGADEAGLILLDRFRGELNPIFRTTRLELDYHYNPPGIRGEPRYVEGVARISKIHGSIDWRFDGKRIIRSLLPFGARADHPQIPNEVSDRVVIYPNSSKDVETSFYPYAELFRDFSSAICRPNSVLVTYGYGFGDSHINRIIEDMLTIPSTHLVIIAYDRKDNDGKFGARERVKKFYNRVGNPAQFTLLLGEHFGDLTTLVEYYLPKSAIDRITIRQHRIINDRSGGGNSQNTTSSNEGPQSPIIEQE